MWREQMSALMAVVDMTFGLQMLLLGTLVAITIFRKEMSCNRCYAAEPDEQQSQCLARPLPQRTNSNSEQGVSSETSSNSGVNKEDKRSWDERHAEQLLEGAGCYYSSMGMTTYHLVFRLGRHFWPRRAWESLTSWWVLAAQDHRFDEVLDGAEHWCVVRCPSAPQPPASLNDVKREEDLSRAEAYFPDAPSLPTDVMVHVLSFLHPRDVISLACTSRRLLNAIENDSSECSIAVWKALWYRDYSWLVLAWDVGREAAERSLSHNGACTDVQVSLQLVSFTREFYFRFGLSFLEYVIAGQCSEQRCLVGLGGHIYDLTEFLDQHPGSPETVRVHAGRDASAVFEIMRHTSVARTTAQQLCIVVDDSWNKAVSATGGVRPTQKLCLDPDLSYDVCHVPAPVVARKPNGHPYRTTSVSTLALLKYDFSRERDIAQQKTRRRITLPSDAVLGEAHAFYDPLLGVWKAWYLNKSMKAVFLDDI